MSDLAPWQILLIARQHYEAGRFGEADGLCCLVLETDRNSVDALHLAALAADGAGNPQKAITYLSRAVAAHQSHLPSHLLLARIYERRQQHALAAQAYRTARDLSPEDVNIQLNLGRSLRAGGKLAEAIETYQTAAARWPDSWELANGLGLALLEANRPEAAAAALDQAQRLRPDDPAILRNLAEALRAARRFDEAINVYRRALELTPTNAQLAFELGVTQRLAGNTSQARTSFELAISLDPAFAQAQVQLGNVLCELDEPDQAFAAYRQALALRPDDDTIAAQVDELIWDKARYHALLDAFSQAIAGTNGTAQSFVNAGVAFQRLRRLDAAMSAYRKALELQPDHVTALNNLALALMDAGRVDEAIALLRQAVGARPEMATTHSNLVYCLHFQHGVSAANLHREHDLRHQRHAAPLAAFVRPHDNDRSQDRRLRIGYVSPDFRIHPVGRFLAPWFANHDHSAFEIFCYSSVRKHDAMTTQLRACADHWIAVSHLSDEQLADRIREDRIDVLIDLTMHMSNHRLLTFARKPAPVQITYLAYCSTTGLKAIEYRITDHHLDPPDAVEPYSEKSIRLPDTYWCYAPGVETPPVNALPALSRGYVTFGCLNNFGKVSVVAQEPWAMLLRELPTSRLLLHTLEGEHRQTILNRFATYSVDPSRLEFVGMLKPADYFAQYRNIDIALDPFPYPGGTTTCDALWMGVPVISLVGEHGYSRSGLSILSNIGLSELAVGSSEEYLRAALSLTADLQRLSSVRRSLRQRMLQSPLMDAPRFAGNIEAAYRTGWQDWCNSPR